MFLFKVQRFLIIKSKGSFLSFILLDDIFDSCILIDISKLLWYPFELSSLRTLINCFIFLYKIIKLSE